MATIHVIDDDLAVEAMLDSLRLAGHIVERKRPARLSMEDLDLIARCDLVVLDVIMERPDFLEEVATSSPLKKSVFRVVTY
jgi:hypothetical protein